MRAAYNGVLVSNTEYTAEEAERAIANGQLDAIAFGTSFLANPDLPNRFAQNAPLNAPDLSEFYYLKRKGIQIIRLWLRRELGLDRVPNYPSDAQDADDGL